MLICPKCKKTLHQKEHVWQCENKHCYDIAKRGYVNLVLGNHKQSGDEKGMIVARTNFLKQGYYQPLCEDIIKLLSAFEWNDLVDAGCGEGFYTNKIASAFPDRFLYGFDLSKQGVDHACKTHTQVVYGVANIFHLPLADTCVDGLLSIFAPFDIEEVLRVVKPGGFFIKVGPNSKHLFDLKQVVYEQAYENEVEKLEHDRLERIDVKTLKYTISLRSQEDIWALFQMTPYYWKSPKEGCDRLRALTQLDTIVDFCIEIYKIH